MFKQFKNITKGFTLIELLIVIAIIGVLAALLMSNFIGVRQRARDSQRKSDLRQVQSALELYRSDNGSYPVSVSNALPYDCLAAMSSGSTIYMQKVPCDPTSTTYNSGKYYYNSGGTNYTIGACLENGSDTSSGTTNIDPITSNPGDPDTCPGVRYFVLNNP
ncbi:MAG: prepilin-type N-terminal cleavage/methylation domain-containing protein [Candidatus Levybacteria bacterium]|nr:prepilin-type N-terminal cleavage/methylation domain-containing protein [Candidatus Levybacteria bacterium]